MVVENSFYASRDIPQVMSVESDLRVGVWTQHELVHRDVRERKRVPDEKIVLRPAVDGRDFATQVVGVVDGLEEWVLHPLSLAVDVSKPGAVLALNAASFNFEAEDPLFWVAE